MSEQYEAASLRLAEIIKAEITKNPHAVLALPTGRTPVGAYRLLSRWSQTEALNWSQVKCFALDEYLDVDETHSFRHFLQKNLYKNIGIPEQSCFYPFSSPDYDELIAQHQGLDFTMLGIGQNGHIAFNEPGTPLQSWTHMVRLTESTQKANAALLEQNRIPTYAITVGIQTILNSKRIVLAVTDEKKKEILRQALRGPMTADVPASFLQLHSSLEVVTTFDY